MLILLVIVFDPAVRYRNYRKNIKRNCCIMSDYSPGTVFDLDLDPLAEDFDFSSIPDVVGGSPDGEASKKRPARTLAPNLTRRSHKKSRGGCFSCKARKIKVRSSPHTIAPYVGEKAKIDSQNSVRRLGQHAKTVWAKNWTANIPPDLTRESSVGH